jgi:ribonuclease BN (tRNA processing enzyme)
MKTGKILLCVSLIAFCYLFIAQSQPVFAQPSESSRSGQVDHRTTQIVLLGTGTPITNPFRSGPSTAIVVNGVPYIVDFGPGVIRRAEAAYWGGVEGLKVRNLKRAFVTHLHSDHTAGYPDLILTPWVMGRNQPLEVYGPEGVRGMTEHILTAYQQDIYWRLHGLEPANSEGHKVMAFEVEPGVVYQDSNVTVEAFPVNHGSWPQAFGYKFFTPDKVIVISGDTAPSENLVSNCTGCDVLIHEVYCQEGFERLTLAWQEYHSSYHTSSHELAEIATRAKPGLLILYHQLFFGSSEKELLAEIQERYDGKVVSGKDLEVY